MPSNAELLNTCGQMLSEMDFQLAAATERLAVGDKNQAQYHISKAHSQLAVAGKALGDVADAVLKPTPKPDPTPDPKPQPQPEPIDPPFTGFIDPISLSPIDLAFYHQQAMGAISGKIFSGNRTRLNQWIARDYEASKVVTGAMLANYVGILLQFKGKTLSDFH